MEPSGRDGVIGISQHSPACTVNTTDRGREVYKKARRQEGKNWFDLMSLLVYCLALSLTVEIDLQ